MIAWLICATPIFALVKTVVSDSIDSHGAAVLPPYNHLVEASRNMLPKSSLRSISCASHIGTWYNQHGSKLTLETARPPNLLGTFISTVGIESAKEHVGQVVGSVAENGLFAFHVVWNNGTSITAWTGQCQTCGQQDVLLTSWILTEKQASCGDVWKANRFGQDVFKRER
ncbi:hypothetical protein BV898_15532 [Hypsibius exemplaris]|uniref:Avidin n=1 Tax=Hypsibius exemplaris TaxID=2072580 RepID=A0A9X6NB96_HYPEX|nr:hypothetical protein BV898_15532 [Hypsibius exemplaris]